MSVETSIEEKLIPQVSFSTIFGKNGKVRIVRNLRSAVIDNANARANTVGGEDAISEYRTACEAVRTENKTVWQQAMVSIYASSYAGKITTDQARKVRKAILN